MSDISADVVEKALEAYHATNAVKWPGALTEEQKNAVRWDMLQAVRAAVLAEREACANVARGRCPKYIVTDERFDVASEFGDEIAAAIRARNEPPK
jgi:hypothetical protein